MTIDKKKIGKFIGVSAAVLGTAFVSASVVAKKKKALARSLECEIPQELYEELQKLFGE